MKSDWSKNKDFSKVSPQFLKKMTSWVGAFLLVILLFLAFEIYFPLNPGSQETIVYTVQKGWGDDQIGKDLQKLGIIRSSYFFKLYSVLSLKHSSLQAGQYSLSPRMSAYEIANDMAQGNVIRDRIVVPEG